MFFKKNIFNERRLLLYSSIIVFGYSFFSCTSELNETSTAKQTTELDSISFLFKNRKTVNIPSVQALIQRKKDDKQSLYILYNELGRTFRERSDFSNAVSNHQKALLIAKELKDTVKIIEVANQLGTDYRRIGLLSKAAEAHFKALRVAKNYSQKDTKKGKRLLSFSYNGIGNVYKNLDKGEEAYNYFRSSFFLDKDVDNYLGMAMNSVTMGSIKEHQGAIDSAYFFYYRAMHYDSIINSKKGIAICHNRIGQLLSKEKKWEKALSHYKKAQTILEKQQDTWNKLKTENEIAFIYIKQKKYNKALQLLVKVRKTAKERKMYGYLTQTYYLKGLLHTEKRTFKSAATAWKLCLVYSDSVQIMSNERKVMDSRIAFEREMSNKQIEYLGKAHQEEKKKRKFMFITGTIISILLLGLLLLFYFLLMSQKNRNQLLKESNMMKDKLFSIISHDLKAPAIAQKMAIDGIKHKIDKLDDSTLKSSCSILQESTENQIIVIENLMNWTRLQTSKLRYTPQAINLIPIIKDSIKLYKIAAMQKSIQWQEEIPSSYIVYADRQMITIVVRNLINNAVKFTNEGGSITISCKEISKNIINVSIVDNGVGMTEEQIANLYTKEQNMEIHFGTKGEKGTGLGLILCKDLLERNDSRLRIESEKNKGTKMQFIMKKI